MNVRALVWTLRIVLLVQSAGILAEATVDGVHPWAWAFAASCFVAALAASLGSRLAAGYTAVHALAYDVAAALAAGPTELVEVPAHAVRFGIGLALALLPLGEKEPEERTMREASLLLRLCVSGTFAGHGIKAIFCTPAFLALLDAGFSSVGFELAAEEKLAILRSIGLVDLVVAALVLSPRPPRLLLLYMAVWGFLTAAARIVHAGPLGVHDALVRAANGGVPLALLLATRDGWRKR